MTPSLNAPGRRWPLARLGLLTLAEAGLVALTAMALRDFLLAVSTGASPLQPLAMASAAAAAGFAAGWTRQVCAEDFGMRYANALRSMLAAHAVSAGERKRLGSLAVRLTGDLNPMRDWASLGLSDAAGGLAALAAGLVTLGLAADGHGVLAGTAVLSASILVFLIARRPLVAALESLRVSRGRVAAAAGDIVLAAGTIARYDAFGRERRRIERRAERLRKDSVRRRRWAAAIEAPSALAAAAIIIVLVIIEAATPNRTMTLDAWALALLAAGIIGVGLKSLARATDSYAAFVVARKRMDRLALQMSRSLALASSQVDMAPATDPEERAQSRIAFSAMLGGRRQIDVKAGEVVLVFTADASQSLSAIEGIARDAGQGLLGGLPLALLSQRDLARRVGLAAPSAPLLRASLRRNLSLRRTSVTEDDMVLALRLVGLVASRWPPERRIDPAVRVPDEHVQALLRLARAITHKAKVILVAEPVLLHSPDAPDLFLHIAQATGAAVIAASAATPREGIRQVVLDDGPIAA